ncbi:MAG: HEAT repeat domain-containing protein [candidate division WOR-3 bacterium]
MPLDRLLADLQSTDPEVRRAAIDRLQQVGSEEAAGALVLLLADPDATVRQKAADALVRLGSAAVGPVVRYLTNWNGPIGTTIPKLLGELRIISALDLLLAHVADRDSATRAAIATALGQIGSATAIRDESRLNRDIVPALLDLLRDLNSDVKVAAACSLGLLALPETVDALLDELPDDNPAVRIAAADALGRIGDRRAVDSLSRLAGEDVNLAVRRTAEAALRRISRHAVGPLVRALAGDSLEERLQAVSALLEQGKAAVIPLTSLLTHSDPAVRASAADVLGTIGDPACLDALLPLIHDHDSSVRLTAARALGRISHPRCAERLARALQDNDPLVAAAAADSLVNLGEIALEPVFKILSTHSEAPDARLTGSSPETRVRAIAVLGRLRHRGSCELLVRGLQDSTVWVRIVSAQALGEIRETTAVPALIEALRDRDAVVRAMAAEALGRMCDYRATMPLLNLLSDSSDLVRINSLKSLGQINNPLAIPFVMRSLAAAEPEVRAAAITALAMMGAREVLPRLKQIARIWPLSREPRIVKQAARCAIAVLKAAPLKSGGPDGSDEL